MKLSSLFAKYLYQYKELNLPGIGVFNLDPSVTVPDPSDRYFNDFVQQIRFTQKPVLRADPEFIDFIREQTGKIRPLAESDLESFISDGKILLNIGKPFYFEGIGSLQKNRAGFYEFTPGLPLIDKLESSGPDRFQQVAEVDRRITRDDYTQGSGNSQNGLRKFLIFAAIIIGLVAVVWGGYIIYNKNNNADPEQVLIQDNENKSEQTVQPPPPAANTDTSSLLRSSTPAPSTPTVSGNSNFIIERTGSKARALKRYNQLKSYLLDIKMTSNPDSTFFKLYFTIPAVPSDTTRIKDSLKRMYNTREIIIE